MMALTVFILLLVLLLILNSQWSPTMAGNLYRSRSDYVISDVSNSLLTNHSYCHRSNPESHNRLGGEETGFGEGSGRSKVEVFGEILKRHVHELRRTANRKVELVFLVDSSGSVGSEDFLNELKFVKKLLADFTVDRHTTRVSVITFSSKSRVIKHIDHMTHPKDDNHKCSLLEEELPKIEFTGGGTYTIGALQEAQTVFRYARPDAKKALFLITDGYSNGGDPMPEAEKLKWDGVEVFTFGIRDGNFKELCEMASEKKEEHTYILNTFEEFEVLARRALHEDLHVGNYIIQNSNKCNSLCDERKDCCDSRATCRCGTHTGKYECVCQAGYYGNGLKDGCLACPEGMYKNYTGPGDKSTCIPCPDPNQASPPGSTSIDQCQCRKGFRAIGANACAAKTCPDLTPPDNGYFVQGQCNNEVNAACGIRCKNGYTLHGSSLRLCTEEGAWTGTEVTCEVKRCPRLSEPLHGRMDCTKSDYSFDTHCHFHCLPGYRLVGSKSQSCLAIAHWSGIPPKCREVKCPELPMLIDGKVTPETCTTTESSYGTICTSVCRKGYKMVGPHSKQCMDNGKWTPDDGMDSICVDITPPVITCPNNITVDASVDENVGHVTWELPAAVDNSAFLPSVTVVPALIPPVSVPIGENWVTYTAEDSNKNKAKCSFAIIVRDTQRPRVDKCISPTPFMRRHDRMNITWEEPIFSDNSFQSVKVTRTRDPGVFPLGTTTVTYTATDKNNNSITCDIKITVQEHACSNHPVPFNGDLDCKPKDNGITCTPSCRSGYGFAIQPSDKYFCDYDVGEWKPSNKWPVKDCSVSRKSNHVRQTVEMQFKLKSTCKDRLSLNHLESNFEKKVKQKASGYCQPNMVCDAGQFETTCVDEEELDNRIRNFGHENAALMSAPGKSKERVRRSFYPMGRVDVEYQRDGAASSIAAKSTIAIKYDINGSSHDPERHEEVQLGVIFVMKRIVEDAKNGEFDSIFRDEGLEVLAIESFKTSAEFLCQQGSVLINSACIKCPGGTFFNVIKETCEGCPKGTYQPEEGQLTCLVCPNNTSTSENNSRSIQQCRGQCLPGSFSKDGVEWCETCPIGSYQPSYAQLICLSCPNNTKTWRRGSRKLEDCAVECKEGYVSKTGLEPCFPCPRGYFQPEKGKSSCFICPEGVKTQNSGSIDITDCEGISQSAASASSVTKRELSVTECFSEPCQNGASCVSLSSSYTCQCQSGWRGMHCEIEDDECLSNPCQNNGTCLDEMDGYSCSCNQGYSGNSCEYNIDECVSDPCLNNATCVDLVDSYRCECLTGFNGTVCEENIDDCEGEPCKNGGTCLDGVTEYRCQCAAGFQGSTCEVNIDECATLPCQNNGTCIDEIGSFSCLCKLGYVGAKCEFEVNECLSEPCDNGATCLDLEAHYVCKCTPSYSGVNCETKLNSSFDFNFPKSGITDYAAIEDPFGNRNLTEITIAFWLRTDDKENQGTPISYATSREENAFVLTDYSGFVFYVNGKIQHTDVTVNDGNWHHIAVTWKSEYGAWQIYKDGKEEKSARDIHSGSVIEGGGMLVIGQEQDARGARFSISESFIGNLSRLNIWDTVLSTEEINRLVTSCDEHIGSLIAWPDFLGAVNGRVERLNSQICTGCDQPLNVSHGSVIWNGTNINDSASYSCFAGYEISGIFARRCLLNSTWSGMEPQCVKVSCGHPGDIPHGYVVDNFFTFGNTIRYSCVTGYRMVGNNTRYCNASASWEGEIPKCVEIFCILPTLTAGLRISGPKTTDFRPGDVARFQCGSGYQLIGHTRSMKCNMTGYWSTSLPHCEEILCGQPPETVNGRPLAPQNTTFKVGERIYYECFPGYSISYVKWIECQENGAWRYPPSCFPVTCARPFAPRNGFVDVSINPIYNSTVVYRCEFGYVLFGGSERKCLANRSWSGEEPSCAPISCSPPGEILHGHTNGTEFFYKKRVIYYCDQGYALLGTAERICGADGSWISPEPSCEPVKCPLPGNITHGHVFGSIFTFDSLIEFACDSGFQLVGDAQQKCLANGSWSNTKPTCERVLCTEPVTIQNGLIEGSQYETGSVIRYICGKGYEIEGKDTRSCRLDGTWTGPTPKCNSIRCVAPENIQHGRYQADGMTLGSTIEYQCDSGYVLNGSTNRTCTDDKAWSGNDPSCQEVLCEKPQGISHGSVNGDSYRVGSSVFYKCEPGYELKGPANRFCTEEKIWNGSEPFCSAIDCDKPSEIISNGRMVNTNFSYGSTIHYVCDDGYYIDGSTSRTCKADGSWLNSIPVCERVECPRPARPPDCDIEGHDYRFKEKVHYRCKTGYQLIGPNVRICQADKTWSGGEPRCKQIECSRPNNITNGKIVLQGLFYKNVAYYRCNTRYWLKGTEKRECTENGTWSGVEPTCAEVMCGKAPSIDYGRPLNDEISAGMTVEYQCDEGYHLVQSAKLTCSLEGGFSGNKPRCIKVQCPKPQPITNGQLEASDVTLGSTLRYTCDTGFELVGLRERTCGEDSQWSGLDPICVLINCGPPDFIEDAEQQSERYDFGATVTYTCNEGFVLESGDLNRSCLADSKWSGDLPVCKKVSCPRPVFLFGFIAIAEGDNRIERHVQDIDRFVYGITVEFDCEEGFYLNGERELNCLINGSWSGAIPSCERVNCSDVNIINAQILSPKGFKYGFRTLIQCDEGYELNGSKELNCLANGSWSSEIPTCSPVTCEDPPQIDNIDIRIISTPNLGYGYPFGITIGFQCYEGFELIGTWSMKCLATRQWSSPFPTCRTIVCSPPLIEGESIPIVENPKDVYGFGETLRFRCGNGGYELLGSEEIGCNENKTWNGTIPRCVKSVCQPLSIIHAVFNGSTSVSSDQLIVGKVISVECEDGYQLSGSGLLRCTENRTWSADLPRCVKVTCFLPVIPNAEDLSDNFGQNASIGKQVIFKCNAGHRLSGASSAVCNQTGNWSEAIPECILVTCSPFTVANGQVVLRKANGILSDVFQPTIDISLEVFPNGTENPNAVLAFYKSGDIVNVQCDSGHNLTDNNTDGTLICLLSGSWSAPIPSCTKLLCEVPSVKNSQIEVVGDNEESTSSYTVGTLIQFNCDSGYKPYGEVENVCQSDGTWSEPFPTCEIINCSTLSIANANISTTNTSFGTTVNVVCVDGFELFGDWELSCGENGMWSRATPNCLKVACKVPEIPSARLVSTSILPSTVSYGDKIRVECLDGYRLVGQSELKCDFNKKWSPSLPVCEQKHCVPLNFNVTNLKHEIQYGSLSKDGLFPFGTEVNFQCDMGYQLEGKSSINCKANENWSASLPSCSQVFCSEPFIKNGFFKTSSVKASYTFGQSIRFRCNPGFQMVGESEMFCQPNGEWTAEFPVCVRLSCPKIPQIQNGVAFGSSVLFEATVTYRCDAGYELIGQNNVTCLANQTWSRQPACQRIKCPTPISVRNGEYTPKPGLFPYESTIRYVCDRGYEIVGQVDHVCQANGQWSGEIPTCLKINCFRPPFIPHAYVIGDSYLYGDTLSIRCHEGYRLSGVGSIECLWNKTWSRVTAVCNISTCGEPPFVRFSVTLGGRQEFNSTIRYVCNVGYEIVGNSVSTCLANGSWTYVNAKCNRIKCPVPTVLRNGLMSSGGHEYRVASDLAKHREFYYEDKVVHSCERGYELFGIAAQVCMSDGQWNETLARCDPVECTRPPTPRNCHFTDVLRNTYTYGQTVSVECEIGFLMKGSNVLICQHDQTWNSSEVFCEKITCPVPGFFQKGGTKGTDFTYGGQITYSCMEGYSLIGERNRVCGTNGKWNGSEPFCQRITCSTDDLIENGYVEGKDYSYQAVRIYHCNKGYRLNGDSRRTCQSDGQWSGRQVVCSIQSCGALEKPDHGFVVTNSTTYQSIAEYGCDRGYELYGDKYRECDHNGWWTGFTPTCVIILCIDPPPLLNGRAIFYSKSFGSTLTYTCDSRYNLVGNNERKCLSDRMWSGEIPVCQLKLCPLPVVQPNVRFSGNDFSVGSTIEFQCSDGYTIVGKRFLTCLKNESWNGQFPVCERVSCKAPPPIKNAAVPSKPYKYGDSAIYDCLSGYKMQGDASVTCEASGSWNDVNAVCNPVWCGDPPQVKNARSVQNDGQHFGDIVYYVCNEGYDLHGNNLIECSADGLWTGSLPHCELITCGVVPVIPHASTIVHKTTYGSKASYECNRGYILQGSSVVVCKANGTWAYEDRPTCVPVHCGEPRSIRNGGVRAPDKVFDSIATYYCFEGFKLSGTPVVHCGDDGRWSGVGPICDPVVCSSPEPIANSNIFGSDYSFGHSVLYSCKDGYRMVGDSIRTCQPDGVWSGRSPSCELIYCGTPDGPENGQLNFTGLHFGSEVKYWCSTGFSISGVDVATCDSDGNWTNPAPLCLPAAPRKECLPLPSVENAVEIDARFIVGDSVTIECKEGYFPSGLLQFTCQDDLSWTGPQGNCHKVTCHIPSRDSMVVVRGFRFQYGDRTVYACRQGLIPATDPVLTCMANGQWDKIPDCRATCKFECQNGGTCIGPNKCKCQQGYGGRFCETAICVLPCLNGGHCVAPYKCECPYGYGGFRCELPICAKPCQNGGRCIMANRCLCPHGFVPPFCERPRLAAQSPVDRR